MLVHALVVAVLVQEAPAPAGEADRGPLATLESRVRELTLDNGWRFLLVSLPGAPVVAFETYAEVGSVHERPGITGMAHMFEHMAFKGSDRIGSLEWPREREAIGVVDARHGLLMEARESGDPEEIERAESLLRSAAELAGGFVASEEFSRLLENAGGTGSLNASTSADETRYVVSLPSNQIELWCWLEAERFGRGVLREFYRERDAVMEERRMRVESDPFGLLLEHLVLTAFLTHPYRHPTVGYAADIAAYTRADAQQFFAEHYGARRLVTAIVGDVDPERLEPMLRRYFAAVPSGPDRAPIAGSEARQTGERRIEVAFPANPFVAIAWHVPALAHADSAAVDVAVRLLGYSRSSRLERRLVREDGSAAQVLVTGGFPGNRYDGLALVIGIPNAGVATATLEAAIDEEIARLAADGPSDEELAGVKRVARAELYGQMRDRVALASLLTEYEAKTGDWRNAFRRVDELAAVTADDVKRVLGVYFGATNRTVATLTAPAQAAPDGQPEGQEDR